MSLLDEIRSDLVNESATLPNILRKAKILASAIRLPEFSEWVDLELNGYRDRDTDKVPNYRRFRPTNLGTFAGPFGSGIENYQLPTSNLPAEVKDFAENLIFFDGVGALEAQESGPSQMRMKWPQEYLILAREATQLPGGMVLIDAHQPISNYLISGILDQVKNKLLDFVLGLQESNITSEDLDNRTVEPQVAQNLYNVYIYGDHNNVASGENVNQRVNSVRKGDQASLLGFLREINMANEDLCELADAVSSEPVASDGGYGPKVKAWLGGMISKAASKTWNFGLEKASIVLTDALNAFYGCC